MASDKEIADALLHIFKEDGLASISVEDLYDRFIQKFEDEAPYYFTPCQVLITIMGNPELLSSVSQTIGGVGVLLRLYSGEPLEDNPFAIVIHGVLSADNALSQSPIGTARSSTTSTDATRLSLVEKLIVGQFSMAEPTAKIWKEPIGSLLKSANESLKAPPAIDLSHLEKACRTQLSNLNLVERSGIPGYLTDINVKPEEPEDRHKIVEGSLQSLFGIEKSNQVPLSCLSHRPEFITLAPPLHFARDELVWMTPTEPNFHVPIIDPSVGLGHSCEASEALQLINQAFKEALSLQQRQTLLNELDRDHKIVTHLGVTPQRLPDLVENNPMIAIDVILKLMETGDMNEFFSMLVNMDMSVHSMEVVNRLTSTVELPKEFLYLYISNCIKTCEGFQDKYMQNRLVRLLCVFLQSLIRNRIIDFQELYIEILTFCVEFSRIREAAALYRLMKQMESEDSSLHQILSKKLEQHQHLSEAAKNFPTKDKDSK